MSVIIQSGAVKNDSCQIGTQALIVLKEKWTNQCFKTVGNTDISKIVNEPPPLITCLVEDPKWTPLVIVKLPDPLHWPSKLFFE